MERFVPQSTGDETEFLGRLLVEFVSDRLGGSVRQPEVEKAKQLARLLVLTAPRLRVRARQPSVSVGLCRRG
jgi:hypothetical protein